MLGLGGGGAQPSGGELAFLSCFGDEIAGKGFGEESCEREVGLGDLVIEPTEVGGEGEVVGWDGELGPVEELAGEKLDKLGGV